MKRYDLEETGAPYESDRVLEEDPEGEWVKWEDVKGILQYKDQLKGYKLEAEGLECNCEEKYPDNFHWFCPAHGYKRR